MPRVLLHRVFYRVIVVRRGWGVGGRCLVGRQEVMGRGRAERRADGGLGRGYRSSPRHGWGRGP